MAAVVIDRRLIFAGAAAGGLALAWVLMRPRATAEAAGRTVVGIAEGAATGVVVGIGEAVGVPETNRTQCEADKAAGRTWEASFSCPAGDFIKYIFS